MHILYLSSIDISRADGPGVNEREFVVEAARRLGQDFVAVLPRPVAPVPEVPAAACHHCVPHHGYRRLSFVAFTLTQTLVCVWLAWRRDVDLAVVRVGPMPLAARVLQRLCRVPVAVKTLGRLEAAHGGGSGAIRDLPRRLNGCLQRAVLRAAIAADAATPELAQRARPLLGPATPVQVIDNAVNVERFRPGAGIRTPLPSEFERCSPVVGFAGGSPSERGARQLVECLVRLRDTLPQMGILVVGDDPDLDAIRRMADDHGLAARCVFTGAVTFDEVPGYVARMDLCVSFDAADKSRVRGNASQKVRQYLAMGKPVISTDAGNAFLIEHDLGSLVDARDADRIAALVLEWWRRMEEEGPAFAERARRHATEHLSTRVVLEQRLAYWRERLASVRG